MSPVATSKRNETNFAAGFVSYVEEMPPQHANGVAQIELYNHEMSTPRVDETTPEKQSDDRR